MLAFLREQKFKDPLKQKQSDSAGAAGADADGAEQAQEQEYLTVAGGGENVRRSTILLVVLFGIGLLGLWFMIKKSTPQKAAAVVSTEEAQIEAAIARLGSVKSEMFRRMDEIVKGFYELTDVPQVQVNELVRNPFKHELYFGSVKDTEESEFDSEMMEEQQLRERARNMQLFSIMQSERGNCCMIDDKILYKGDSIRGFKVGQIGESFVKLELEGMEIVLRLLE